MKPETKPAKIVVIPAQPGFFVVNVSKIENEDGSKGTPIVERDPVLAWAMEEDTTFGDVTYEPKPIILGIYTEGINGIMKPDGTVWLDCTFDYASLEEFVDDTDRREAEWRKDLRRERGLKPYEKFTPA